MANSIVASANIVTKFQKKVNHDYIRKGRYGPFTGSNTNSVIQIKQGLKIVSIPLVSKIPSGEGVVGSQTLSGNEKALSNFAFELQPTYYREGVLVDNEENEKSEFELKLEARPALMGWGMELKRDHITQAFGAIYADSSYSNYGDASATELDTWNENNEDRLLYALEANYTSGDHTASLAAITTAAGQLSSSVLKIAKDLAEQANPIVRPLRVEEDQDWYVFFCESKGFRQLQQDDEIIAANTDARARNLKNPIFTGGDLLYDGIVIKKVPDMKKFIDGDDTNSVFDAVWGTNATSGDGLDDGGNSSTRLGVGFLCGAQAQGFGLGRMPSFKRRKEDDYEHQNGIGLSMKHDIKKMFYNNKQHGVVTVFYSAVL